MFFTYEWFDHPEKMQNKEFTHITPSTKNFVAATFLKPKKTDYLNLLERELTTDHAVVKLKMSKPALIGIENYQYLQQLWKQEQMSSYKNFELV